MLDLFSRLDVDEVAFRTAKRGTIVAQIISDRTVFANLQCRTYLSHKSSVSGDQNDVCMVRTALLSV